jgi:hypothetical protein
VVDEDEGSSFFSQHQSIVWDLGTGELEFLLKIIGIRSFRNRSLYVPMVVTHRRSLARVVVIPF